MIFPHEDNIKTKIKTNYYSKISNKNLGPEIKEFYEKEYLPVKDKLLKLTFDEENLFNFDTAANIFYEYYKK